MNLIKTFKICTFERYADFKGKSTRSEFWSYWFIYKLLVLGLPLASFTTSIIHEHSENENLNIVLTILFITWALCFTTLSCPYIAVLVRRLHDAGYSRWNVLWILVPKAGWAILFFLMIQKSKVNDKMSKAENPLD